MTRPTMRPIMRYHGGKWRIAPWVIAHFPPHEFYVEPFGGAGSVLLQKPRARRGEVYNDLDGEICNLFRVLRDPSQGRELIRQMALTPYAREEFELGYMPSGDPIEQARRTLARATMGMGSAAATRQKTGFRYLARVERNTNAQDWANLPPYLAPVIERLRGVIIENLPAIELIAHYPDPHTLIYADPPYPHSTRTDSSLGAYRFEMSDDEHRALAASLRAHAGPVVISGYGCDLYDRELYGDWLRVQRSTHGTQAVDRIEVMWLNDRAAASWLQPALAGEWGGPASAS